MYASSTGQASPRSTASTPTSATPWPARASGAASRWRPATSTATGGGTAINGGDYAGIGTSVSLPANQTTATVTITPIPHNTVEGPETVTLTLAASDSYLVGTPSTGTVTIAD
jgi:hypothetical protein